MRIRTVVEYYLANSGQQKVQAVLSEPSAIIGYSIEKQQRDGESNCIVDIYNEIENHKNTFQRLYLSGGEYPKLFECDQSNDQLVEFMDL